jgi:hypothetical protein
MSASSDFPKNNFELTSTLNLGSLRAVPDAKSSSQILNVKSSSRSQVIVQC